MSMKLRLVWLERASGTAGERGAAAMLRTAEERQIDMEVWLHGHQIMHDELDRKQALAYARELHLQPVRRPSCPKPMPADVRAEIDMHRAEIEREHAALPTDVWAGLDRSMRAQEALASRLLTEAATAIQRQGA